jgi:hypothetical protein
MSGYNESAYKQARDTAIALPCPFERALLSLCATCCKSRKLLLAEREAISCTEAARQCHAVSGVSSGACMPTRVSPLHMDPNQPWPFGKEIRAQCGGILGLRDHARPCLTKSPEGADISQLVDTSRHKLRRHRSNFPYSEIMRAIVHYEPRKRRGDK